MKHPARTRSERDGGNLSKAIVVGRWGTVISGSALALLGLTRRSKTGLALAAAGGLLAYKAARGKQPKESFAESSFAINCTPEEAYRFWHNFENLPLFMRHLESVKIVDNKRSEWTAIGPLGVRLRWTAEIVEEAEPQWIVWRSLEGSDIEHIGSVQFRKAPGDRGTIVVAVMEYNPPAGAVGKTLAAILGKDPEFTLREDLRRFKQLMEAKEIPTIEGQPHGPRSAVAKALHAAYPEKRKPTEFEAAQRVIQQTRRVS
ncbi:MAG: SRPBCC family protein [Acidobacteriales bacterium]|nr:SRPBCC family protein [Terriglobales bacterium]